MDDETTSTDTPEQFLSDLQGEFIKILEYAAPQEVAAFQAFGDGIIRELSHFVHGQATRSKGLTFEFGPALDVGLVTVHLVAGTLALIDVIHRAKIRSDERTLESKIKDEWTQFLVAQGMSAELAREIPVRFSLELAVFLAKQKIARSEP